MPSYQYLVDMGHWHIRVFLSAESGSIYNVGSEEAVSILELAETVSSVCENVYGIQTTFSNQISSASSLPKSKKDNW